MGEVTADGDIIIGRIRPKNNPLIHRSEVGKPAFHNDMPPLPPDYTFGAPLKKDPEGAGEVMLTWQEHRPPPSKLSYDFGRDFKTLNKQSVRAGCINPKDVASYRKSHDARILPKVTGKKPLTVPDAIYEDNSHSYGGRTEESESVADLIQNRFELEWVTEQRKRQMDTERRQRAEKERRAQRASPVRQLVQRRPVESTTPQLKDTFVLKQFQHVASRYNTPSPTVFDRAPSPAA